MKTTNLNLILLLIGLSTVISCNGGQSKTLELSCEADLPGHTLATMAGSYYDNKYSKMEGVKPFLVNAEADAVQAVRQGIADVLVVDEVVFSQETIRDLGLKLAFKGEEAFPCAMAFKKGDTELLPLYNEFLSKMKADGSLDAHSAYWLEEGEPVSYPEGPESTNQKPIRYLTCISTAPVAYIKDGEWTGLDPDLVKRFGRWVGRPVETSYVSLASAILALQTGQADIVSGTLFPTEIRRQYVDFSEPYSYCRPAFFVKDEGSASEAGFFQKVKKAFLESFVVEKRWKLIVNGLISTILITLLAIILGTILGMGYCAMALGRRKWMRATAGVYDYLMQGIPILVLLLIMFYVVLAGTKMAGIWVAAITFALNFAASSGNVFASSVSAVPKGQWEAGHALGFTSAQTFRWVIFPQAVKSGLGAYQGHCVALLKGTSIVGYIAVMDLTRASDLLRSRTFDAIIPLLVVTVLYFVLAWLLKSLLNLALRRK